MRRCCRLAALALVSVFVLALAAGCRMPPRPHGPVTGDLDMIQLWSGDYPKAELQRLPPGQKRGPNGFLGNPAAFEAVWQAFKPGDPVPTVDFKKHLVVFSRNTDFYNRMNIVRVSADHGIVEVAAISTMTAMPITDKVAVAMVVVPRAGITGVRSGNRTIPVPVH